jgi:hypothetical protein
MKTSYTPEPGDVVIVHKKFGEYRVQTIDRENQSAKIGRLTGNNNHEISVVRWEDMQFVRKSE